MASDQWKTYLILSSHRIIFRIHQTVNHSDFFNDPKNVGVHSQKLKESEGC